MTCVVQWWIFHTHQPRPTAPFPLWVYAIVHLTVRPTTQRVRTGDVLLSSAEDVIHNHLLFHRFPSPGGFQSGYPPPNSNNPFPAPGFSPPNQGYPSPSGPPPGPFTPPSGPPPNQYQPPPGPPGQNQWSPPPGPPPFKQDGYPGQQGSNPFNQNNGGYPGPNVNRPPPGPPPPSQGPPSIPGNRPIGPPSSEFSKRGGTGRRVTLIVYAAQMLSRICLRLTANMPGPKVISLPINIQSATERRKRFA